jgi:hypothetical protein
LVRCIEENADNAEVLPELVSELLFDMKRAITARDEQK